MKALLTSTLDGDKWSASRPGRFTLGENPPYHWAEVSASLRAGMNAGVKT
jgi:hypothetical protein